MIYLANEVHYVVDLKKLYVALIKKDDDKVVEFEEPKYLPGVKEIGLKVKSNTDNGYAEGIVWDSESTLDSIDVDINIVDLSDEDEALLLGHTLAKEGGVIYNDNDKSPEVALLWKSIKANKKARYIALYRGKFELGDEEYKGKEGKTNFQGKKIKATFMPLKNNGIWKWKVDEENGMNDEKFFKKVIMPTLKENEEKESK